MLAHPVKIRATRWPIASTFTENIAAGNTWHHTRDRQHRECFDVSSISTACAMEIVVQGTPEEFGGRVNELYVVVSVCSTFQGVQTER